MMCSLVYFQPSLQCLTSLLSQALGIDVAVIDKDARLIACTKSYREHKGYEVHSPFVNEVLHHGNVLVSKPGQMRLCSGCRFQENCPATAEILSCIKLKQNSLGVISFSTFSGKGKVDFVKNPEKFFHLLDTTSQLISFVLEQNTLNEKIMEKMIRATMDLTNDGFLFVDNYGKITDYNKAAEKLLQLSHLKGKPVGSLLPKDMLANLQNGRDISNFYLENHRSNMLLSSVPIKVEDKVSGAVIQINPLHKKDHNLQNKAVWGLDDIIGNSDALNEVKSKVKRISQSNSTVLITGETGTGKELFARAIHAESSRAVKPFVAVNCAGIPETLLESELFGYDEGAFTGAKKGGKPGRFQLANGGTIFLDEIGDMSLNLQAKLLRVLQERVIDKLGSLNSIPIDIRIIAATNKNLEEEIQKGTFRQDLYYRLNVIPIEIPPLRERTEDIRPLTLFFLDKYTKATGKNIKDISKKAMDIIESYPWPGNVRELENAIEYAVNMETQNTIRTCNLPNTLLKKSSKEDLPLKERMKNAEYTAIKSMLDRYGWDMEGKTRVADELDISLRTLYRIIKKNQ